MASSVPEPPRAPAIEQLLRRDRWLTSAGLFALVVLAWAHTTAGAGMGMDAWQMTSLVLFPHAAGMDMAPTVWTPAYFVLVIAMWWTMMVAMMTPSAAPTILLFAHVHRHAQRRGAFVTLAPTAPFVAGYLAVWLFFSLLATGLQFALESAGLESAMGMGSQSRWLSATVLVAAGLYQFSPLKDACLSQCRSPFAFLTRYWQPGSMGAFRLGLRHGAYCLGCCWVLMILLFVGGVMNLAWIAGLTVLVMAEKWLAPGRAVARAVGVLLIVWGLATLWV